MALGLLHNDWFSYTHGAAQVGRLDAVLSTQGAKSSERIATDLMAGFGGDLEQAAIQLLCEAAGVDAHNTFRLISGTQFNRNTRVNNATGSSSGRRAIDFVIVDNAGGGDSASNDSSDHTPVIAVEAKFEAYVNGKIGYCTEHDGYSNQVICYPQGCMNSALKAPMVKFLWLGLPLKSGDKSPLWSTRAITEADLVRPRYSEEFKAAARLGFDAQREAEPSWKMIVWPTIWSGIQSHLRGKAVSEDVIGALLRALGATPGRFASLD
jgi:hypothetical protein